MTFHAACGRILRREAQRLGYRSNFTIYDTADQLRLVEAVPRGARARPEALHAARHPLADLEREEPADRPRRVRERASRASTTRRSPTCTSCTRRKLFASNAVDFDDMLYLTVDVLERFPEAQEKWQKAFRYVLVDEYQDTNHAQYRFLQLLAREARERLRRRRSRPVDLRVPRRRHPQRARVRARLPGRAHDRARAELPLDELDPRGGERRHPNNRERKPKNLWSELGDGEPVRVVEVEDEHAEARYVAAEIAMLVEEGYSGSEIAVFYRTNAQSRVLEDVLVRQGVAYQVIGGPALLRARGGQGSRRVPAGDRQPVRRRVAAARSRTGRAAGSATRRSRS